METDTSLLELSCKNILGGCPYREGEALQHFHHTYCKGWCDHYTWDEKNYPNKPEFFSKSQLRKIVEKLGDGDSQQLKDLCWEYANGVVEMVEGDETIIMPADLRIALKRLTELPEETSYFNLLVLYSELRLAIRAFVRVQGKIAEGREEEKKNQATKKRK